MNKKLFLITIIAIIILVTIVTILIFSQKSSEQITIEEAKTLAIHKVYPRWDETNKSIYRNKNIVLDVDRDLFGNYIVHVCDLNDECTCRPNEGYWIKVTKDRREVSIQRANLCHYG